MMQKYLISFFISIGIIVAVSMAFIRHSPSEVEAQTSNIDWPQFQHDAQHTGRTSVSVAPNYQVAWARMDKNHVVTNFTSAAGKSITDGLPTGFTFTDVFSEMVQPIIAGGKTYFGNMDGKMYAVDALTGTASWEYQADGAILSSAAYDNGTLVFTSLDKNIYGLNASNGTLKWKYATGAGIIAPPVIANGTVYIGSRDGNFYALDSATGTKKWSYSARVEPANSSSPFNGAPIVAVAALSEDNSTVFFGAENMYFYALNTTNGSEKWSPKKLVGQSFLYSWPVVKGNRVVVRTMSSLPGAETAEIPAMENLLTGLSAQPSMAEEKAAILNYLSLNPEQKTMYVFDTVTGTEPFQVAMGRVSGNNYPPFSPVVDNTDRVLSYWRGKRAYFFQDGPAYGTQYCPDFSALDMSTGDRVPLRTTLGTNGFCPELDNGYAATVGGNYLYFASHYRGTVAINLSSYTSTRITTLAARYDCADNRGWGFQIIYFGNDSQPTCTTTTGQPDEVYGFTAGHAGASLASTNGTTLMYVNEGRAHFITAIKKQ